MHCLMLLAGFLATLIGNGLADGFIPGFLSPPNSPSNPVYTVGDSIDFEWVGMSGTDVGVYMWQQSPEPSASGNNGISLLCKCNQEPWVSMEWTICLTAIYSGLLVDKTHMESLPRLASGHRRR